MNAYEMYGRDEMFYKIGHDQDDDLLCEAISGIENPQKADDKGLTYLHIAALHYQVRAVEALLKMGANPNCVDNRGKTPLSYAIGSKNPNLVKTVQLLLDYGADLDAKCGDQTIRETIKTFVDSDLKRFV